jgi:hypothetical protein
LKVLKKAVNTADANLASALAERKKTVVAQELADKNPAGHPWHTPSALQERLDTIDEALERRSYFKLSADSALSDYYDKDDLIDGKSMVDA